MATKKKLAWDYIVPVVLPKDIKNETPGKLPAHLLTPAAGGGKMHWIACAAWNAMVQKAKAEGVVLKPTSSGDTYREYEFQKRGFLTRYQLKPIPGQSTKTFEGKTWYLKKGMAMLATPGKSQHNLGLAVDVHSASEPKRLNWLIANVKEFGFSWEVVPSEPWHIRYVCGDKIPATVKAWMDANGVVAPVAKTSAPKPAAPAKPSTPTLKSAYPGTPVKQGSKGAAAKLVQAVIGAKTDGNFGPQSVKALKSWQSKKGLTADGVVGPTTWAKMFGKK